MIAAITCGTPVPALHAAWTDHTAIAVGNYVIAYNQLWPRKDGMLSRGSRKQEPFGTTKRASVT